MRFQSRNFKECRVPFIDMTPRSTRIRSGSTILAQIKLFNCVQTNDIEKTIDGKEGPQKTYVWDSNPACEKSTLQKGSREEERVRSLTGMNSLEQSIIEFDMPLEENM